MSTNLAYPRLTFPAPPGHDPVLRDSRHRDARAARECADWLSWLAIEGKAPRTLDDYERSVAVLLRTFPEKTVEEFTDGDLMYLLKGFPAKSRRYRRAHLNSFFAWAKLTRRIDQNPLELVPKIKPAGQRVVEVFTDAELALLVNLPSPDGPLFALMKDTGLRKSECRRLIRSHINLDRAELVVYRGKGDKDRVIPLSGNACRAIADLDLFERLEPHDHLWYSRPGGGTVIRRDREIGEGTFARWWADKLDEAGVAYIPRTTHTAGLHNPHVMRHTFATRCLRVGIPLERVSLLMGHVSVRTTFDLYAHLDLADVRRDVALLDG